MVIHLLASASAGAAKAVVPAVAGAASSVIGTAVKSAAIHTAKAVIGGSAAKVIFSKGNFRFLIERDEF